MNRRWTTSLHEASHGVIGVLFDHEKRPLTAVVLATGAGYCRSSKIPARADAVVTAAGDYGAKLARIFAEPEPMPAAGPAEPMDAAAIRAAAVVEIERQATYRRAAAGGDDCARVDRYVIELHPGRPREWLRTRRRVCASARLLVWKHREAIRRAAGRLYHAGEITISETDLQPHVADA
jgi:hypothetical protein